MASFVMCAESHRHSGPCPPVASKHLVSGAPGEPGDVRQKASTSLDTLGLSFQEGSPGG